MFRDGSRTEETLTGKWSSFNTGAIFFILTVTCYVSPFVSSICTFNLCRKIKDASLYLEYYPGNIKWPDLCFTLHVTEITGTCYFDVLLGSDWTVADPDLSSTEAQLCCASAKREQQALRRLLCRL